MPDVSIEAVKTLWTSLGKDPHKMYLIENDTITLYKLIPKIWEWYLEKNKVNINGVTLNTYWISHPAYERSAGLIPVHFYKFSTIKETATFYIKKYYKGPKFFRNLCVFMTDAGSPNDP